MKYGEADYLNSGFYDGDMDVVIDNYKSKIVKCRRPHQCNGGCGTVIKPGDMAMLETGFEDGEPVTSHTCIPCLDKWLDETIGKQEEFKSDQSGTIILS